MYEESAEGRGKGGEEKAEQKSEGGTMASKIFSLSFPPQTTNS
jgi:hypothetical protein